MEQEQEGLVVAYKTRNHSILELILHIFPRLAFDEVFKFNKQPLLCVAARDRDVPAVKIILKHWKILNPFFQFNHNHRSILNTALSHVIFHGSLQMVYSSLKHGADDLTVGLYFVARNNHMAIAKLLLSKGANIHDSSKLALRGAIESGHTEMLHLLLERGTSVDVYSWKKKSFLCFACKKGHLDMVDILIEKGANLKKYGNDALFAAIRKGHFDIVCFLLEKGADVQFQKDIALREAIEEDQIEIAKLLV